MKFVFPIAIHSGDTQPTCAMLEPFVNELCSYMVDPIEFEIDNGNTIVIKNLYVKLLLGICDAPALCKSFNLKFKHSSTYAKSTLSATLFSNACVFHLKVTLI